MVQTRLEELFEKGFNALGVSFKDRRFLAEGVQKWADIMGEDLDKIMEKCGVKNYYDTIRENSFDLERAKLEYLPFFIREAEFNGFRLKYQVYIDEPEYKVHEKIEADAMIESGRLIEEIVIDMKFNEDKDNPKFLEGVVSIYSRQDNLVGMGVVAENKKALSYIVGEKLVDKYGPKLDKLKKELHGKEFGPDKVYSEVMRFLFN